ncbi:MAG: hypothetical protein AAF456_24370, partial [Planctomycetota bacterium]
MKLRHPRRTFTLLACIAASLCFASYSNAQTYFLGFGVAETGGSGVQITSITPGGPVTRLSSPYDAGFRSAQVGDTVVQVNGVATPDINAFNSAVARLSGTGGNCSISIRNQITGTVEQWNIEAQLAPGSANGTYSGNRPSPPPRPSWNPSPGDPQFGPRQFDPSQPVSPIDPIGQWPPSTQPPNQLDLGITGRMISSGFLITGVDPAGPASRARSQFGETGRLQINQVINTINGRSITSESEYQQALAGLQLTGGVANLGIVDVASGRMAVWTVNTVNSSIQQPVPPIQPVTDPRIHFLLCGAPASDIQASVAKSLEKLNGVINVQIASSLIGSRTELSGAGCSRPGILQALDNLQPGPEDAIFFYYVGHGAFDATGGHFCNFTQGDDLLRHEIQSRLAQKGVR